MFIVSITYKASLEKVDEFIPEHIEFLNKHYELGVFQLSGRKVPRTGGVILATVVNRAALDLIFKQDPFQRENLADYEVTELVVTKSAKSLECLLGA